MDAQGRQPAGQCRPRRIPSSRIPRSAHRIAQVFDRGLTTPSRLRAAGAALAGAGRGPALALGEMEAAARLALPGARRQPGRLPPAARHAAHVPPVGLSLYQRRSIRRCRAGRCPTSATAPSRPPSRRSRSTAAARSRWRVHRRRHGAAGARRAGARRGRRRGAHRALGRAARRPALRLHAAGRERRGLSRADRRRRGSARRAIGLPIHIEGYAPAARSAAQRHPRGARPRRHRGQHPSRRRTGRTASPSPRRSTRRRGSAGSAPTSS